MKTGFSNIFANIPAVKYYKYHGMLIPCNKQPDFTPILYEDLLHPGPVWELRYEIWPVKIGNYYVSYDYYDFIPSSEYKYCYLGFPDNLVRYYFFEIAYYNGIPGHGWFILFANGKYCNWQVDSGFSDYFYLARSRYIWGRYNYLMIIQNPGEGTHVRVWRSSTGELPPGYPVPPT